MTGLKFLYSYLLRRELEAMAFGGSESRSQLMVHRSVYSEIQGDSKRKSVIEARLMI